MIRTLYRLVTCLVICLTATCGYAADKALLVGIGTYQIRQANLPGIGIDLDAMRRVALAAGIHEENIVVLSDRDATLANFRIVFQREFKRGLSAGDRALIYFSGHGTQVPDRNGDEKDESDEALMMHDTQRRYSKGVQRLENVLLDDEIEDLLADIPTNEVLVVVDACHSGTVTRFLNLDGSEDRDQVPKSFVYDGMPPPSKSVNRALDDATSQSYNYIALTASRDDQLAIATSEGSVFTAALSTVVQKAEKNNNALTLAELHEAVAIEVRRIVEPERLFTPQLSGDADRANRTILVSKTR